MDSLKRFIPYLEFIRGARLQYALAIFCGVIYGATSGAVLPLTAEYVFPLIFLSKDAQVFTGASNAEVGARLENTAPNVYRVDDDRELYSRRDSADFQPSSATLELRKGRFSADGGQTVSTNQWALRAQPIVLNPQVFYLDSSGSARPLEAIPSDPPDGVVYFSGARNAELGARLNRIDETSFRVDPSRTLLRETSEGAFEASNSALLIRDSQFFLEGQSVPSNALWALEPENDFILLEPNLYTRAPNGNFRRHAAKRSMILVVALLPLTFLLRGASGFTNVYFINYTGLRILEGIRVRLFQKLQTLPVSFFKNESQGDLLSRLFNDTLQLQQSLLIIANDLIKQPITLISALAFVVYKSFQTSEIGFPILALAVVFICVLPIRSIGKRMLRRARTMQRRTALATAVAQESIRAYDDIRAYGLAERETNRFQREIQGVLREQLKIVKYQAITPPTIEFLSSIGVALAVVFAAQAGLALEEFIPLALALYMAYEPVKKLGAVNNNLKRGLASLDRIEWALDCPSEPEGIPPLQPTPTDPERLEFRQTTFHYTNDVPALNDVSLSFHRNESVALVGPSGAGKSTIASLITRFYTPTAGVIELNGQDIQRFPLADYRNLISIVGQRPFIFRASVFENIAVGRIGASEQDIHQAARRANAEPFIQNLKDGYNTEIGDDGALLSGGQRQRIALARAFLRDAPIVVLDEATSALDATSETLVQDAIQKLFRDRIGIVIAHRLSAIRFVDKIVALDAGRVVGVGPHRSLYQDCALYKALYDQQLAGNDRT